MCSSPLNQRLVPEARWGEYLTVGMTVEAGCKLDAYGTNTVVAVRWAERVARAAAGDVTRAEERMEGEGPRTAERRRRRGQAANRRGWFNYRWREAHVGHRDTALLGGISPSSRIVVAVTR